MRSASILSFLCFTFCLNWGIGNSTTVYNATCNDTSECTIYPNISQGPEVIWIPFICNENNFCDCPNGWAPFEGSDICVTKISGSSTVETCSAYVWAIGFFVVTLLAVITYSCVSLFSRRSRASLPMKNDQRFPGISFRAKV